MGLNGEMDVELIGYLNVLNPVARSRAMSKLVKKQIPSQGSRAEFEKFFPELTKHIKEQTCIPLKSALEPFFLRVPLQRACTIAGMMI